MSKLKGLFIKDDAGAGNKKQSPEEVLKNIRSQDGGRPAPGTQVVEEEFELDLGMPEYSPIEGVKSIEEFYTEVGLVDEPIYGVKPFIDALSAMPMEQIKVALAKTLTAAKMDIAALNESAFACTDALTRASNEIQEQTVANVAEYRGNIEALKAEIAKQEQNITKAESICAEQKKLYAEEVKTVEWIATHIREGV